MTHARGIRLPDVDRHADPAALPAELRAARRRLAEADPDGDWWCCTPQRGPDGILAHDRSCPARRRTA